MKPELAHKTVAALKRAGIDFVSYIPETRLSEILPLMKADEAFTLAPVSSEAEAVGIAAGAALGGKRAAVYMEGTGLFVSAYNLLTVGERYGVPMLLTRGGQIARYGKEGSEAEFAIFYLVFDA